MTDRAPAGQGRVGGAGGGGPPPPQEGSGSGQQAASKGEDHFLTVVRTIERIVNQNNFDDIIYDYRYWEDTSDDFRPFEGSLLPLWKLSGSRTRDLLVADVCWSPAYPDLLAAAYTPGNQMACDTSGLLCLYTLKNPGIPERCLPIPCGLTCVQFHPTVWTTRMPRSPQVRALSPGNTSPCIGYRSQPLLSRASTTPHPGIDILHQPLSQVWDIIPAPAFSPRSRWGAHRARSPDDVVSPTGQGGVPTEPGQVGAHRARSPDDVARSPDDVVCLPTGQVGAHRARSPDDVARSPDDVVCLPTGQVRWVPTEPGQNLSFYSVAEDGRVSEWMVRSSTLEARDILEFQAGHKQSRTAKTTAEPPLEGTATCMALKPDDRGVVLVGVDTGVVLEMTLSSTSQGVVRYAAHSASVRDVVWNGHHNRIFATCSVDWMMKIWLQHQRCALVTLDLGAPVAGLTWCHYSSCVIVGVTEDGRVHVYDLFLHKCRPLCVQNLLQRRRSSVACVALNPFHPVLLVGGDRGYLVTFKLSPNLRRPHKDAKGADEQKLKEIELAKMERVIETARV
ncbi:dynein intermediate chain 2, ciliary-like [Panulirus ornatus]|uniref:dynein intermediate chain 2, ciliary-like n=1 Tax=Panulirus ornatus TaxID=150431 RepID=UPI003A8C6483